MLTKNEDTREPDQVQRRHQHLSKVNFNLIKILSLLLFLSLVIILILILVSLDILIRSSVSLFDGLLL